jgi:Uma2 family endonuclease
MSIRAKSRKDIYQELFDLPENMVGEIIGGELHAQPRPAPKHALASSILGAELGAPYSIGRGGPGGWWILAEPEVHLGDEVLVPDISGWKKDRMPQLPETSYFEMPPDWVCEILSPSTAKKDRTMKMPIYAKHRVNHIWLIDPDLKTLEAYRLEDRFWKLVDSFADNDVVSIEPFDDIAIDLSLLWSGG